MNNSIITSLRIQNNELERKLYHLQNNYNQLIDFIKKNNILKENELINLLNKDNNHEIN